MRALAVVTEPSGVAGYFDRASSYWDAVYADGGVQAEIYRGRQEAVLELVHRLGLEPGAAVLDAGCGAGHLAAELGRCGLGLEAIDVSPAMVELARARLGGDGAARVSVRRASVDALPYATGRFAAVVAVGLLPWLRDPRAAVMEMARVTEEGGHVILTADNRRRLNAALDPWLNPRLQPLKRRVRRSAARAAGLGAAEPVSAYHDPEQVDRLLREAGCEPVARRCFGFGPFSLFRRPLLPAGAGVAVHRHLQQLADAGRLGLGDRGSHYIVMAERRRR